MTGLIDKLDSQENVCRCLAEQLRPHLEPFFGKNLCICGIGNEDIPADSLGPETAKRILPQMYEEISLRSNFSKVAVICPGVYGKTNLNTETVISGVVSAMDASCVLTVDSCITQEAERLCRCIQLSNTGMDSKWQTVSLRQPSLGVPVVSIVVPTAIHMPLFPSGEGEDLDSVLALSNIGDMIRSAAFIIACAITQIVYPDLDYESCKQCIGFTLDSPL